MVLLALRSVKLYTTFFTVHFAGIMPYAFQSLAIMLKIIPVYIYNRLRPSYIASYII